MGPRSVQGSMPPKGSTFFSPTPMVSSVHSSSRSFSRSRHRKSWSWAIAWRERIVACADGTLGYGECLSTPFFGYGSATSIAHTNCSLGSSLRSKRSLPMGRSSTSNCFSGPVEEGIAYENCRCPMRGGRQGHQAGRAQPLWHEHFVSLSPISSPNDETIASMNGRVTRRYLVLAGLVAVYFLHYRFAQTHQSVLGPLLIAWPLVMSLAYVAIIRLPREAFRAVRLPSILMGTALLAVPMFFFQPLTSKDGYAALASGDVSVRGGKPYSIASVADQDSVFSERLRGDAVYEAPSPYGPLWLALATLSVGMFGGHFEGNVLFLRLVLLCAVLLASVALFSMGKHDQNGWREKGTALFAWNPLIVFASILDLHHDAITVLFLMVALMLWKRWRPWLALTAIAVAGGVRWIPFLLLPFLVVKLIRNADDRRRAWIHLFAWGLVVAAAFASAMLFFGGGIAAARSLFIQAESVNWSFFGTQATFFLAPSSSMNAQQLLIGGDNAPAAVRMTVRFLGYGMFLVLYGKTLFEWLRRHVSLSRVAFAVFLGSILFVTQWFQPWYCIMLLPFALREEGLGVAVAHITAVLFLGYWFSTIGAVVAALVAGVGSLFFPYVRSLSSRIAIS